MSEKLCKYMEYIELLHNSIITTINENKLLRDVTIKQDTEITQLKEELFMAHKALLRSTEEDQLRFILIQVN